jgi:hypothetical protein
MKIKLIKRSKRVAKPAKRSKRVAKRRKRKINRLKSEIFKLRTNPFAFKNAILERAEEIISLDKNNLFANELITDHLLDS